MNTIAGTQLMRNSGGSAKKKDAKKKKELWNFAGLEKEEEMTSTTYTSTVHDGNHMQKSKR